METALQSPKARPHPHSHDHHHRPSKDLLLPQILDSIAESNPTTPFAEIPNSPTTCADGFRNVTFGDLANAVNGVAALLEEKLGKGSSSETLAYVGLQDLRYVVLLLGAVKAGYSMLFFSPRFPPLAAAALFARTGIKTMLVSNPRLPFLTPILEAYPAREVEIPGLATLLDTQYPHYAYDVSFEEARNRPFVTVHTSGSTGVPKPIVATHEWVASFAEEMYLEPPEGHHSPLRDLYGTKMYFQFPFFHMSFILACGILPILTGTVMVYAPAGVPPSASTVAEVAENNDISQTVLSPSTIVQLYRDPELLDRVTARVGIMSYAGSDLPAEVGESVSQKVRLWSLLGSTEYGIFHCVVPSSLPARQVWHSLKFHPDSNIDFVQREGDIYEAVVRRRKEGYTQAVFCIFPDKQEWATGDLYKKSEKAEGFWEYQGRNDDMIVFVSGEKFWPVDVENSIKQHPEVNEALVVGTGRERVALLLDVQSGRGGTEEEVVERIWPSIEATHSVCSPAARILKELIIITDAERPFARTPKGSVQRAGTAKLYAADLCRVDEQAAAKGIAAPATATEILTGGVQP